MVERLGYILAAVLLLVTAGLILSGILFGDVARNAAFTVTDLRNLNLALSVAFALEAGFFLLMAIWPGGTSDVISVIFGLALLAAVGCVWALAKFAGVTDPTRDGAGNLPALVLGLDALVMIGGPIVMAIVRAMSPDDDDWDDEEEEEDEPVAATPSPATLPPPV